MPKLSSSTQKNMINAYGVRLLTSKNKRIKSLNSEFIPSVHGDKNWFSSFLLIDYLLHTQSLKKNKSVLELGCGWGAVSIFCSKHANCQVTGVDIDKDVFPYLDAQAEINDARVKTKKSRFESLSKKTLTEFDLLLGSDICFWDDLVSILFKLIKRSLDSGVKEILIADPGRPTFHKLAEKCLSHNINVQCHEWYSLEPEYFEGYILHIRNT